MKAITLTQPWASLVAVGSKRIETRSWWTAYRGPLAIHAAKGFTKQCRANVLDDWDFFAAFKPDHAAYLRREGVRLIPSEPGWRAWGELPLGAVIATARLVTCVSTDRIPWRPADQALLTYRELAFGDYSPGRWAWILADVVPFEEPIPAKGMLGLWEWKR